MKLKNCVVVTVAMFLVACCAIWPAKTGMASAAPAAVGTLQDSSMVQKVDQIFKSDYARSPYGGMTVGIVSRGKLIWTNSYGSSDIERKIPATKDTVYRIGSITKQFTALMLLQLVEHGTVKMSDPVEKYFSSVQELEGWPPSKEITLLDLATHRSGLAREPDGCDAAATTCPDQVGPVSHWEQSVINALPHVKLESAPEDHVSYSNIGYAILGVALSHAAHQSYIDYVTQNILIPLGMHHTSFEQNEEMLLHFAKGYVVKGEVPSPEQAENELKEGRGYKVPNGALFTTIGDLSKFVAFEMGYGPESVLPKATLRQNRQRYFPWAQSSPGAAYGVGFWKIPNNGRPIYGHTGSVSGYNAAAFFSPDADMGVICLRNTNVRCSDADTRALISLVGS